MDKRQSQGKKNMGMRLFVSGHSLAVLVATSFCGMLAFFFLKERKRSAEKESTSGASAPSLICSTPTERGSDQYEVFLSFRGPDTRKGFADHLCRNLVNASIPIGVFRDTDCIPIGEKFDSQILGAITRSKISIPIISENYASSKWCLRELVCMVELKKSTPHIVLPIFYKVKPADVRHLKGKFGDAFRWSMKYFDREEIPGYEGALTDVSYLNGWESQKIADGHEGELVQKVVNTVLSELRHDFQLDIPKHLVGIDDHIYKIRNWAQSPTTHARMIGIYGMGGIGKTTLAKVIYNELSKDCGDRSYLSDIRDKASHKGIPYVQNQLIKDILPKEGEVLEVDDGICLIKSKFKFKKVLILLDDIDHMDQLNALAREHDWFMEGSIIIVTTRDQAILDRSEFEVVLKYPMNGLDEVSSLFLFNKHAFYMGRSPKDFEDISHEIVTTMGGLPLALEVVGASLYGETNQDIWQEVLNNSRNGHPHVDVQDKLKISYDALKEDGHKKIFLDIACFLIGQESKFPVYVWKDCGFSPHLGIKQLTQRCLIKIGERGEFMMHDQLRDLGRSIFCQGQQPEKCIKLLWEDEEAYKRQLRREPRRRQEGAQSVWVWNMKGSMETYTSELFKNLPSSRFLQLCGKALSGDFNEQFSELRWFRWLYIGPDMSSSAINLHLHKLVVLDLSWNKLTEDWEGWSWIMAAKRLKVLDLSYSQHLRCTPDLSTFTELKIFILKGCCKLEQVHPSIGKVKSLETLEITNTPLSHLPESIQNLSSLKRLDLRGCYKLQSLPELPSSLTYLAVTCQSRRLPQLSCLIHLEELNFYGCNLLDEYIPELPSRLLKLKFECCHKLLLLKLDGLKYLEKFSIRGCFSIERLELSRLNRLKGLYGSDCCNLAEILAHDDLEFLEVISIDACQSLRRLILLDLRHLEKLKVHSCDDLVEIRGLDKAELLEELEISKCGSIEKLPDLSCFVTLKKLCVNDCRNLRALESLERLLSCQIIYISGCQSLEKLPNLSKFGNLWAFKTISSLCLTEIPGIEELGSLRSIDIRGCESMETLPDLSRCEKLKSLVVRDCKKLTQLQGLEKLAYLDISGCDSLETIPELPRTCIVRNYQIDHHED